MRYVNMKNDVAGIERYVAGYCKTPNKFGNHEIAVEFKLKKIPLVLLQELFKVSSIDPDPGVRDMIDCYQINEKQAKALQPYVIDGVIDLEKYDFMLECFAAE